MVLARRNLLRIPRAPDLLISFTVQPIMFVLLFVYVFGGAISTPGYDYVDFLMPGIIVQTMAFGGFVTALGLAEDLKKGLIDRFRSLPIAALRRAGRAHARRRGHQHHLAGRDARGGPARRASRSTAACSRSWRGVALLLLFGYAFSWVFAFLGLSASSAEAAQALGFIAVFPLTFASSAFVPTDSMPSWLAVVRRRRTRSRPWWTRSAPSGSAPRPAPTCGWPSSGRSGRSWCSLPFRCALPARGHAL